MELITFLAPFLGVFSAVIAGLIVSGVYGWLRNRSNRNELLQSLRKELEKCRSLLKGEGNLLPTNVWRSSIATGFLMLIPFDKRIEISSIYVEIANHNFEAERVRDVSIAVQTMSSPSLNQPAVKARGYFELISMKLKQNEKQLKIKIDELLNQNW